MAAHVRHPGGFVGGCHDENHADFLSTPPLALTLAQARASGPRRGQVWRGTGQAAPVWLPRPAGRWFRYATTWTARRSCACSGLRGRRTRVRAHRGDGHGCARLVRATEDVDSSSRRRRRTSNACAWRCEPRTAETRTSTRSPPVTCSETTRLFGTTPTGDLYFDVIVRLGRPRASRRSMREHDIEGTRVNVATPRRSIA